MTLLTIGGDPPTAEIEGTQEEIAALHALLYEEVRVVSVKALSKEDRVFLAHLDEKSRNGEYTATAEVAARLIRRLAGE